jgi:D-tagatose-1,6-bisphosphate aldolase subunit GatZ/KbaZ
MPPAEVFARIVEAQKSGVPRGMPSICSAHPLVLQAAMEQAREDGEPVLIESTVNQVNQYGGYTGLKPADFRVLVHSVAERSGFPAGSILLGGDHLGPYPWRQEPAEQAMAKAFVLVADSVRAGYVKIHLDASMPLGGDRPDPKRGLDPRLVARREAELAAAGEEAFREADRSATAGPQPVYVIGTDVPPPGGITAAGEGVPVTPVAELRETVSLCAEEFRRWGLEQAWSRVLAVVVQPGVEFSDRAVHPYDRRRAAALCQAARELPGLVLEGHSTDYQDRERLREMVEDGVAVLKVGPALTFAVREALFALQRLEEELLARQAGVRLSRLMETLEQAMLDEPRHWKSYYSGDESQLRLARRYSISDRCRYYWTVPAVEDSVRRLLANLQGCALPWPLLSQYLPLQSRAVRSGVLTAEPAALVRAAVREVLRDYSWATLPRSRTGSS